MNDDLFADLYKYDAAIKQSVRDQKEQDSAKEQNIVNNTNVQKVQKVQPVKKPRSKGKKAADTTVPPKVVAWSVVETTNNTTFGTNNITTDQATDVFAELASLNLEDAVKSNKLDSTAKSENFSIEKVASCVLPPMKVVEENGKIRWEGSHIYISCGRGHIHQYMNISVLQNNPKCTTCCLPGKIVSNIRERAEDLLAIPFAFAIRNKDYSEFHGGGTSLTPIKLFIVKKGYDVGKIEGRYIVLPETRSMKAIDDQLQRQCADIIPAKSATTNTTSNTKGLLPYPLEFAVQKYPHIINDERLYIENCGYESIIRNQLDK